MCLYLPRRQCDEQIVIVRLVAVADRRAVSSHRAAFSAFMIDNKALFGVRFRLHGVHDPAALRGAVAGIDVEVDRREAERAVVARREPQGQNFSAADGAYEAVVVFAKAFFLHSRTSFSVHKNFSPRIVAKRAFYGILIYTDGNGFI